VTWRSHRVLSGFCGFALGLSPLACAVLAQSAVLPDAIEGITGGRHRGLSHELGLWLAGFALLLAFPFGLVPGFLVVEAKEILLGFAAKFSADPRFLRFVDWTTGGCPAWVVPLGGILHLLEDLLTPTGVSFFGFRVRFPLVRTGDARTEPALVFLLSFVMTATGLFRIFG